MKPLLFAIALALFPVVGYSGDIASVNFASIKDDLRTYYFAKPENAEIKEKFAAAVRDEKAFMNEIQQKLFDGKKAVDLSSTARKNRVPDRYQLEKKIDSDIKSELYLIVSRLGLKYDLIYDSSSDAVIYAKTQIDDITTTVKQAVIDLQQKK